MLAADVSSSIKRGAVATLWRRRSRPSSEKLPVRSLRALFWGKMTGAREKLLPSGLGNPFDVEKDKRGNNVTAGKKIGLMAPTNRKGESVTSERPIKTAPEPTT